MYGSVILRNISVQLKHRIQNPKWLHRNSYIIFAINM